LPTDQEAIPFVGCDVGGTLSGLIQIRVESHPEAFSYRGDPVDRIRDPRVLATLIDNSGTMETPNG
jgi:hypothetical protein